MFFCISATERERERGCILNSHVAVKWHSRVQQKLTGYSEDTTMAALSPLHLVIFEYMVELSSSIYLYVLL